MGLASFRDDFVCDGLTGEDVVEEVLVGEDSVGEISVEGDLVEENLTGDDMADDLDFPERDLVFGETAFLVARREFFFSNSLGCDRHISDTGRLAYCCSYY